MSRHIFEQRIEGKPYQIIIGWDRPVQQYFGMILEWMELENGESGYCSLEPCWSTLYLEGFRGDLETIFREIQSWGMKIPEGLLSGLVSDREGDIGNRVTYYGKEKILIKEF